MTPQTDELTITGIECYGHHGVFDFERREGQVFVVDLNMPVMNGWEFLEALAPHQQELLGRCHIYILTSSLALSDLEKSKKYELVSGLIHKPIDSGEIRAIQAQLQEEG